MNLLREVPAFLMFRICERGTRHFGRVSRRGELYAAGALGLLFMVVVLGFAAVLNVWVPILASFSQTGIVLIWAVGAFMAYALLVPHGRYRTWSAEFKSRYLVVRQKPALVETLIFIAAFALLVAGLALHWMKNVMLT